MCDDADDEVSSRRAGHSSVRSSAQHELHRNRHPHRYRLPTPAGRLETPSSDRLNCCLVEVWMSSRLLNLYLFYTSLFGDICLDDDGPFDTPSPGRIRVARFHLIATRWQAGR